MFSINNIALDNPALGWELMSPSVPLSSLQYRMTRSESAGRDGVTVSPATRGVVTFKFTVRTPKANLSTLLGLFSGPELLVREVASPSWVAAGRLVSSTVEQHYPRVDFYTHSFLVEIPGGAWRGPLTTSPFTPAATPSATVDVFTGLSAPVQDALVRVRGPLLDFQVTDQGGSYFNVAGDLEDGQYLLFDANVGRAWLRSSAGWSGGSEVSGLVDFGGPRGVFEVTPHYPTPSNPTSRVGRLRLDANAVYPGAGFEVRGRAAFLL